MTAAPTSSTINGPAKSGPRAAPLALWRIAEAFLHLLHNLFGAPEDVARKHTLTQKSHALMLPWLRAGEALLRRLLLIEAFAHVAPPNAPKPLPRPRKRVCKPMRFYTEEPDGWRVSFRCFEGDTYARPPGRKNAPNGKGACMSSARFRSAWPLAERYEAVSWRLLGRSRVRRSPHWQHDQSQR